MFKETCSSERPILIFHDVSAEDLLAVLTYAYTGQVEVSHKNLTSFVNTVIWLQMKGISFTPTDSFKTNEPAKPNDSNEIKYNITNPKVTACTEQEYEKDRYVGDQSLKLDDPNLLHNDQESTLPKRKTKKKKQSDDKTNDQQSSFSTPRRSILNRSIVPGRSSIFKQARRYLLNTKRPVVLPSYLRSFQLENIATKDCKFCGKTVQGSENTVDKKLLSHEKICKNNPTQPNQSAITTSKCPICEKSLAKTYIAAHIKKIHGADGIP